MAITVNNIPSLDRRTLQHFGLTKTGTFYSKKTSNTLDDMEYAVEDMKWLTICGGYGTGKTTLLRQLKDRMFPNRASFVHVKALDDKKILMGGILEAIITDLSGAHRRNSMEARSRQAIRILGKTTVSEGRPVCLVIDNTPDRLHVNTLNALKLLREEDFAGQTPLLSVIILCWPEFLDRIHKRKDITHRMNIIELNEQNGWFTLADRVKYLEDVFKGAITKPTRERIARMFYTPEDLNWYVAQMMHKAKKADYSIIDENVVQPTLKERYDALKRGHGNNISYSIIGEVAGLGASTVKLAIDEEPDRDSTLKVQEALDELEQRLSEGATISEKEQESKSKVA